MTLREKVIDLVRDLVGYETACNIADALGFDGVQADIDYHIEDFDLWDSIVVLRGLKQKKGNNYII